MFEILISLTYTGIRCQGPEVSALLVISLNKSFVAVNTAKVASKMTIVAVNYG